VIPWTPETKQDPKALLAQLAQAQERLEHLAADLRAVDGELEALSTERQQFRLLHDACAALEQLSQLGAAELFWGDRAAVGSGEQQLRRVRSRVEGFEKGVAEIEERRQIALEAVLRQQEDTDWIADDALEAQEEELRRSQDWEIEREVSDLPIRAAVMPWTARQRGGRALPQAGLDPHRSPAALALIIPRIEIPIFEPDEVPAVPDRVVTLISKPKPVAPAPEVVPQMPERSRSSRRSRSRAPRRRAGRARVRARARPRVRARVCSRSRSSSSGIKVNQQLARLGAEARVTNAGAASGAVERSMITSSAPGSSGGINLASLSRGVNAGRQRRRRGRIAGVQIARATSNIAGGGGAAATARAWAAARSRAGRTRRSRSCSTATSPSSTGCTTASLRRDPTLRGQMILRLRIEPTAA
jgi:hypothetical protein